MSGVKKMGWNNDLPRSALVVLDHISAEGPMAPREISRKFNVPLRTVTFALKKLTRLDLLRKTPDLMDMRRPRYHANTTRVRELSDVIDLLRIQMGIQLRAI
ncbi:MarR family transcriptional regulator [Candidatus Thorarchaeota archaeon]|nr:MAG: MarR family transcriptional regulator [Candidatus Thorarchaeota archaeon]